MCAFSLAAEQLAGQRHELSAGLIAATLAGACWASCRTTSSRPGVHGRLRLDADRPDAGRREHIGSARSTTSRWRQGRGRVAAPLLVVAAVLFVPLLDLLMAVVRRTRRGESPFSADKMHLHTGCWRSALAAAPVLLIYLWAGVIAFARCR